MWAVWWICFVMLFCLSSRVDGMNIAGYSSTLDVVISFSFFFCFPYGIGFAFSCCFASSRGIAFCLIILLCLHTHLHGMDFACLKTSWALDVITAHIIEHCPLSPQARLIFLSLPFLK
jgi:hypothetical protein